MRARHTRALPVVLLFLAVLLAGCGDDDTTGSDGGGDGGKTFSDDRFSVTFSYPDELEKAEVTKVEESAGGGNAAARARRAE